MAYEIGMICTKNAGRDSGLLCVIVDLPKPGFAVIDGQTRRRTVNLAHLTPTKDKADVKKGAAHADVAAAFKKLKIECRETKPKKATQRQKKQRRVKEKVAKPAAKKAVKPVKTELAAVKKAVKPAPVKKEEPAAENKE